MTAETFRCPICGGPLHREPAEDDWMCDGCFEIFSTWDLEQSQQAEDQAERRKLAEWEMWANGGTK